MKKLVFVSCLILFLSACVEPATKLETTPEKAGLNNVEKNQGATITKITPTTVSLNDYTESNFSKFILFNENQDKILINLNFFPDGSDLCEQATYNEKLNPKGCKTNKTIEIPCEYQVLSENDMLSFNINAPIQKSDSKKHNCETNIIVDLKSAEFSVHGLIFSIENNLKIFSDYFEFEISKDGFIDAKDKTPINFSLIDIKLEDVYDAIIENRLNK